MEVVLAKRFDSCDRLHSGAAPPTPWKPKDPGYPLEMDYDCADLHDHGQPSPSLQGAYWTDAAASLHPHQTTSGKWGT